MTDKTELKRLAEEVISAAELYAADCCNDYLAASWATADEVFRGIASPAAVLTLFSENERVKARLCVCRDCGGHGEIYSGQSTYQGHNQPPEPDMDVCGTCGGDGALGTVEDFEALAAERDQLKTENDALRKDADRYRWLRGQYWNESEIAVVCHPKKAVKLGFDCPSEERLDCAIDAAMGKGEQS